MARAPRRPDLLDTALELVAERGWRGFNLAELAGRSGRSLAEVYEELPGRRHLLVALGRRLDRAMLDLKPAELDGLSPRERIFELVMRRLDAMAPYRGALASLGREGRFDPDLLLTGLCNLDRATAWLLDAGGTGLGGLRARAARHALGLVYLRVFGVWLEDDTPDRARTMAELDKRLEQAERAARRFMPRRRRDGGGARQGAAATGSTTTV
ncbi:hypothetical protein SH611_13290 [Geminicoccaceae bacterium 1502E]|nr:hypothetical protein [Geminicoccaceae bacterium 1502E]